jgi:hypothetical protein
MKSPRAKSHGLFFPASREQAFIPALIRGESILPLGVSQEINVYNSNMTQFHKHLDEGTHVSEGNIPAESIKLIPEGIEQFMGQGKAFVEVGIIHNGETRNIGRFVRKTFPTKERAEDELNKYSYLKAAGIPVPNTARYFEEDSTYNILYTDLTCGGDYLLATSSTPSENWKALQLSADEVTKILKDITSITQLAQDKGYIMGADSFFVRRNIATND